MRRLTWPARSAGFTLIEAMLTLAVAAIVLGIGVPQMRAWIAGSRAVTALEFYAEGLRQARQQALTHNSASRFVLVENANNGQFDWRVDICFPTPAEPCGEAGENWSTAAAAAPNDPAGATGFHSLTGSSDPLPASDVIALTLGPEGADQVYFTPMGWVDQAVAPRLTRLTLAPVQAGQFRSSALALSLAGLVSKCEPGAGAGDSRRCPP